MEDAAHSALADLGKIPGCESFYDSPPDSASEPTSQDDGLLDRWMVARVRVAAERALYLAGLECLPTACREYCPAVRRHLATYALRARNVELQRRDELELTAVHQQHMMWLEAHGNTEVCQGIETRNVAVADASGMDTILPIDGCTFREADALQVCVVPAPPETFIPQVDEGPPIAV